MDIITKKDLNCGNCPLYTTTSHPIYPSDIHYCGTERISEHQKDCTTHKGCASHPLALQVLAEPVIEELYERITLLGNAHGHNANLSGGNLSIVLYQDVIKLLKGEVKK
jgi:hypothetical protein